MAGEAHFDLVAAHEHFSAWCFNRAWKLIEKPDRTEEEVRLMVALSHASIFRWIARPDCTDKNLSVGYWQASRIQGLIGNAQEAIDHGWSYCCPLWLSGRTKGKMPFSFPCLGLQLVKPASRSDLRQSAVEFLAERKPLCFTEVC